jgi:hypothetical protein
VFSDADEFIARSENGLFFLASFLIYSFFTLPQRSS